MENKHTSDSFGRDQQPARRVFHGENMQRNKNFNNIPILSTPTKRKSGFDLNTGDSLQCILDSTSVILPDQQMSESPAKRRKWGQGGSKQ